MDYANEMRWKRIGRPVPMSDRVKAIIAVIFLFSAYALVGTMEFNDRYQQRCEVSK